MIIGIDIGGTKTALALFDAHLSLINQSEQPTDHHAIIPSLNHQIRRLLAQCHVPLRQLTGIGIGIPGIVDPIKGEVSLAINLSIDKPLNLVKPLYREFSVPIAMENDVRLAAVGLHKKFGFDHLALLNLGTGVSAGMILNGRLHRGLTGMAGEVGHIPLLQTNDILENTIAGSAIMRQADKLGLNINHASELYKSNNPKAQKLIARVSAHISQTILWLIMSYDVERLFIGGGITKIGSPFLTPILQELDKLRQRSKLAEQMVTDDKIQLIPKNLNAGLLGAAYLAQTKALAQ